MAVKCPKCRSENPDTLKFCGECGTQLPWHKDHEPVVTETFQTVVKELSTGSTFGGRYQVIEELGHGGMGRVYRVLDKKLKEEVALKLIKPEIASDRETIERFGTELKLARKISHRNIGRMYELMEDEGTHFITMEYVAGEDLKSFIRRSRQMTAGTAVAIAKQAAEGLAEAHRLGIIHRDLKPSNIMIDKEGNARIMDFGVARSLKARGITGAGVIIGTPEYMSPEQVEGKEADKRSDIYSLGIILYEMVTGRVPFTGDTPLAVAVKHKTETPQAPKLLNIQIPEHLSRVILTCLEKNRNKRYQSAEELHAELERIEKGLPGAAREAVPKKPLTSRDMTVTFSLKRAIFPVMALMGLALVAVLVWQVFLKKKPSPGPTPPTVAVLPFIDLSPQKDHEWLSDGISESLINALSRLDGLSVPARSSSFFVKDKSLDVQEAGRILNVGNVLEGSVQVAGDKLRITAELISVEDGARLWSDRFDRQMKDVFSIQDDIAREIIIALKVKLLGEERMRLGQEHTANIEAYNSYLRGRFMWNKRSNEAMLKAIEYFKTAIDQDPEYAMAYAGLADGYILLGAWGLVSPMEAYPQAKRAALRALEIDPGLAEALNALAYVQFAFDWDWREAEKSFKRALELNPKYATGHQFYSEFLIAMGRFDEALSEIRKAQELDPMSLIISSIAGWPYMYSGKTDMAIEQFQKTLELDKTFMPAHYYLGLAYLNKGMYEEAFSEFDAVDNERGRGIALAMMGNKKGANRILNDLIEQSNHKYASAYDIAAIYFALGENDRGFAMLERAYAERDDGLAGLKTHPMFVSIRSDPRFKALLKKMKLDGLN